MGFWCGYGLFEIGQSLLHARDTDVGIFLRHARTCCEFARHVQLVASDQIEGGEGFVDTGADHGVQLFAQASERGERAAGNTCEIIEKTGPVCHGAILAVLSPGFPAGGDDAPVRPEG